MVQTLHLLYITAENQFALCCVRSPLLTASQLISFPAGTKTFQFPAFRHPYGFLGEVTFRNPRFKGCMRLPWAFRSLPRPSSPL